MTINEGYRCHWCGNQYATSEHYPACSEDHLEKLRLGRNNPERGLQGFEHKGDVSMVDSLKAEADEMIQRESTIKLWAKFINHILAAQAALFELITGEKPPKIKEILAIISGH